MRPGQLRSLLKELRAGGVSEYSETGKTGSFSLKLGRSPETPIEPKAKAPAKAAVQAANYERARQEELARELGVTVEQAREVAGLLGN
jgi:hypothetical protein